MPLLIFHKDKVEYNYPSDFVVDQATWQLHMNYDDIRVKVTQETDQEKYFHVRGAVISRQSSFFDVRHDNSQNQFFVSIRNQPLHTTQVQPIQDFIRLPAHGEASLQPVKRCRSSVVHTQPRVVILQVFPMNKYLKERPTFFHLSDKKRMEGFDIVIIVDDARFYCHKKFLAFQSSFFRAMFYSGFAESNAPEITLRDLESHEFAHFLNILYQNIDMIDEDSIEYLLELSDRYDTPYVRRKCRDFLWTYRGRKLTLEQIKDLAIRYRLREVKNQVRNAEMRQNKYTGIQDFELPAQYNFRERLPNCDVVLVNYRKPTQRRYAHKAVLETLTPGILKVMVPSKEDSSLFEISLSVPIELFEAFLGLLYNDKWNEYHLLIEKYSNGLFELFKFIKSDMMCYRLEEFLAKYIGSRFQMKKMNPSYPKFQFDNINNYFEDILCSANDIAQTLENLDWPGFDCMDDVRQLAQKFKK